MRNVSLYFKSGNSDKVYHVQLEKTGNNYVVNFQYGRRGSALQSGTKTSEPVSLEQATKIYNKLVAEKKGKGYEGEEGGQADSSFTAPVVRAEKKEVILLPQLLNTIEQEELEQYINDEDYIAQEKMDGERRMLISESSVKGLNKKGTEVPLPTVIVKSLPVQECILDGEIIGDKLFVFDVLSINGKDLKSTHCTERLGYLNSLNCGKAIEFVYTASSAKDKRALYEKLKAENKEGIVFKKKFSPYTAGRPASGGNALKFKFQNTATFVVKDHTKGKRSVGLEMTSPDGWQFMGKVTIPPNHDIPNVGELVEVQYLYCYKNGCVFQPVYKGKRTDSDLTDATISQIVYKNEIEEV